VSNKLATNASVFAMAGNSVFRHVDTEVDFLLPIVLPSSPAIANTFLLCAVILSCPQ
jgi:hypothetical protein